MFEKPKVGEILSIEIVTTRQGFGISTPSERIMLPEGAAITITNNCGECLLVEKTAGNKYTCKHPKAMQQRPYADTPDHKNERRVNYDSRPGWCPL